METNTVKIFSAAIIIALISAGAAYTYADNTEQVNTLQEEVNTLEATVTDLQTQISDYQNELETVKTERDNYAAETEQLQAQLENVVEYVPLVEADYNTIYEVNRSKDASEQNIEDSFYVTVNNATDEVVLETTYSLKNTGSAYAQNYADSITVYDGKAVVGDATIDNYDAREDVISFDLVLSTTEAIEEFDGTYRVQGEHNFDIQDDEQKFSEIVDVEFTVEYTETDYFVVAE